MFGFTVSSLFARHWTPLAIYVRRGSMLLVGFICSRAPSGSSTRGCRVMSLSSVVEDEPLACSDLRASLVGD